MTKILYSILLFLVIVGIIGGIGYTVYYGGWFIAVGIVALGYLAYPKAKELFMKIID